MTPIEILLVGKGFDEVEASVWAKFLGAAFAALRAAEATLADPGAWRDHVARDGALLRPRRGAAERGRRLPSEEGVTCALAERLWAIRVGVPSDHVLRLLEVQFSCEVRMPSRRRTGKNSRRCDIWIRSARGPDAPAIVLEAKLVVDDDDLRDEYLGVAELGCFTKPPDPHTIGPLGGMIAYTVEDGPTPWAERLEAAMADRTDLAIAVPPASSIAGGPDLWTEAERPDLGIATPISIAHLVMRFAAAGVDP